MESDTHQTVTINMISGLQVVLVIVIVLVRPTCGDFVPKIASVSPGEFPVFSCLSQHSSVDFTLKTVGSDTSVILYNQAYDGVNPKYALDYRVDESDDYYNLTVLNATLAKAGTYKCEWDAGFANADLVVLESSTCFTTSTVIEECDSEFSFECSVGFHGNVPPEIEFWRVSDQVKAGPINATEQFVEWNTSRSVLVQEVSSSTSSGYFECQPRNSHRSICSSYKFTPCDGKVVEDKGIHIVAVVLPVVIGILVVLLLLFILAIWRYRWKKSRREHVSQSAKEVENGEVRGGESTPMLPKENMEPKKVVVAVPDILPTPTNNTLELIELLSDGGFYECYKSRHPVHGFVSFKKQCVDRLSDESGDVLKNEAEKVRHLHHQNIAKFLDTIFETAGTCVPGTYGTIFEYLELDMSEFLAMFSLDWNNKLSLITDVALGMRYLHSQTPQVIHGNLRIDSVLVHSDFKAKVSDFGFTQWKSQCQSSTARKVGNDSFVPYPPEFVAGDKNKTVRFDVYSFAILIWETITQQKPFSGIAIFGILAKWIVNGKRPDMKELLIPGDVSDVCIKLMERCWAQTIGDRPTFTEIVPILEKALTDYYKIPGTDSGIDESKLKDMQQLPDGGYFRSFKATLPDVGNVVYKNLPATNITREEAGTMRSEVDALRKLNHPNLVNPLSVVISAKQTLGFIVPYHENGNLHQYLRKTSVSRMTKISLLHDVACGMRYIHDHKPPIIHGDLKIENVLVSVNRNSPIAKICDSGLQQWKTCSQKYFKENSERFGTVVITPPEYLSDLHLTKSKSTKYDVYSFGILTFQTLTLQKPYDELNANIVTTWVLNGTRPTVDENLATGVYTGVVRLMKTCWSQEKDDRPDFRTIAEDLRREMKSSNLFSEYNLQIIWHDYLTYQVTKPEKFDGYFSIMSAVHEQFGRITFKKPIVKVMKYRDTIKLAKEAASYQHFLHRNILKLVGTVVIPGSIEGISIQPEIYGLAFEYDGGNTLLEYLRKKKPTWGEKLPLVHDVASAMSYLHNLKPPVTHGDLKMENVVVNADDKSVIAKVSNFGFSITIERNSTGTFEHYPPENLKEPNFPKQEAFDVYGFAILMWRVLTPNQKIPYSEATGKSLFELVLNDDARPSLELVSPDVSRTCIDLMKQCWSTAEKDRPGFTEIVDKLEIEMKSGSHTNNNNNNNNNNKSREPDKNT